MFFSLVRPIENGDFPSAWTKGARTSIPIPGGNRKIPGSRATAMKKNGTSMENLRKSMGNLWEIYGNHLQLNGTSMEFPMGNGWD